MGSSPSKKGLWVSRGQSPPLASSADILSFSRLPKRLHAVRSAGSELQNNPGDCSAREGRSARESAPLKRGSVSEVRSRGSPLLQGFPSFSNSPPDCLRNSPFSERTSSSANRKCISLFEVPDWKVSEVVKKCGNRIRVQMRGFAPSIPTPPLKRVRS